MSTHATGRGAALHIAQALSQLGVSRALVPAFAPEGLIAPLIQSGLKCEFYRLDSHLSPDLASVDRILRAPGGRAVVAVIHFFGFLKVSNELRGICEAAGALILEDCAQALLSRDENGLAFSERATLSLFSLNKFLPVCEGATAFSMTKEVQLGIEDDIRPTLPEEAMSSYSAHLNAVARLAQSQNTSLKDLGDSMAEIEATYERYYSHLHPRIVDRRLSDFQRSTPFPAFNYLAIAYARRRNAELLYEAVDWTRWESTEPLMHPGVIPFAIPLRVRPDRRDAIMRVMLEEGVWLGRMQNKWDFIPSESREDFQVEASFIAGHVLVPVGEWIGADEIVNMARALNLAAI
jgi:hypothetical protein